MVGLDEPDLAQDSKFGNQVAPEGPCCHLETKINYENWDILRGILRGKASLEGHSYSSGDIRFMTRLTKAQVCGVFSLCYVSKYKNYLPC